MTLRRLGVLALLAGSACTTGVEATNPYDPDAPPGIQAPGRIRGQVVAPLLDSVEALQVKLLRSGVPSDDAATAEDGSFTFDGLAPGLYSVTVAVDGFRPLERPGISLGVGEELDLGTLELEAENRAELLVTVTGNAILVDQPSSSGILVRVVGRAATTITDAAGDFTLELAPGSYSFAYSADGFDGVTQSDVEIPAGEAFALQPATLRARPAHLSGWVCAEIRDDLKAGFPGGTGACAPLGATYGFASDGATSATVTVDGTATTSVQVDAEGHFVIGDLGPGSYSLRIAWNGYRGVVQQGLRVAGGEELVLDQPIPLELARGGVAGVILTSDNPADDHSGTVVQIAGWSRSTTTDRQGNFSLDGLMVSSLAGGYQVVASRPQFVELRIPTLVEVLPGQVVGLDDDSYVMRRRSGDVEVLEGFYVNVCAVTLSLDATESTQYRASQDPLFAGVAFQPLVAPDPARPNAYPFTLSECGGGGADGHKTIYVQFADASGIPSATQTAELVLDRAPPEQLGAALLGGTEVALAGVPGPAWFSASATGIVPLGLAAVDPASGAGEAGSGLDEVWIDSDPAFANPLRVPFGPSAAVTLPDPGTDGVKTLYLRFFDRAGNFSDLVDVSGAQLPVNVVLDTEAPAGVSLSVASLASPPPPDPTYTSTVQVLCSLTATDLYPEFLQISLSNDPGFRGAVWEPFLPSRPWFLPPGDGDKTVYVRFRDGAGNLVTLGGQTVHLLTTPPGSPTLALTAPVAPNGVVAAGAAAPGGLVLATSAVGAFELQVSGPVTGGPSGFAPYATSWTGALAAGDGPKRITATFRDRAGNVATALPLDLTLDTAAPTAGTPVVSPAPFTAGTAVTIRTPAAGADEMRLTGALASVDGLPGNVGAFIPARPDVAAALTAGDGPKNVTVEFRDLAGNASGSASTSTTLDSSAPTGSLAILGTLGDGRLSPTLTARQQVTLQITATDAGSGASQMRLGNSIAELAAAPWLALQGSTAWTLSAGDGAKTVYLQLQDAVGNQSSAAAPISAGVTLDSAGPMTPVLLVTAPALGFGNATSATAFTLQVTSSDAAGSLATGELLFQGDLVAAGSSSTGWLAAGQGGLAFAGGLFTWSGTLSAGDGPKAVTVFLRDQAGNVAPSSQVTFLLQTTPPAGATAIVSPAPYALTRAATLALSAVGARELRIGGGISDVNGAPANVNAWLPYAGSANVTLTAGDGVKAITVEYRNAAGLAVGPVITSTRLDQSAPVVTTMAVSGTLGDGVASASTTTTTNVQVALSVTDAGGLAGATVILGEAANPAGGCVVGDLAGRPVVPYAAALPFLLTQREGNHLVCAQVVDAAGNPTAPGITTAAITLDTVAPSGPTVRINQGATAVTSLTVDLELNVIPVELGITQVAIVNGTLPASPVFLTIPAVAGGAWTSVSPPTYRWGLDAATASGSRTVSVIFRDGSRLSSPVAQATTWVDPTAPTAPTITVRQPVNLVAGTKYTGASNVSVDLGVAEDQPAGFPLLMKVACDGNLAGVSIYSPFQPTVTCPLSVEGTKTLRAIFRNAAGLDSAIASDSVVLDLTPPTAPHLSTPPATVCTEGATVCVDTPSGGSNPNGYQFLGGSSYSSWSPAAGGGALVGGCFTVTLIAGTSAGQSRNVIQVRGIDLAGNVSPPASVEIVQQTVPPAQLAPGSVSVVNGNGRTTLRWTRSTGPDVAGYLVHYGPIASTDPADFNGRSASEGPSPIDVGRPCSGNVCEFTLTTLVNGVQLFGTIEPYDDAGLPLSIVQCAGNPSIPGGRVLGGPVVELKPDEAPLYLTGRIDTYPWGQIPYPKAATWGDDGMLFIADATSGLVIVDASNPTAPVVKGRYAFGVAGFPVGGGSELIPTVITPMGKYVYALFGAAPNQTLYSIDVSNPAAPALAASRNYGTVNYAEISFRSISAASHRLTFWYLNGAQQIYGAIISDPLALAAGGFIHTVVGSTYAFSASSDVLFYHDYSVTPRVVRYYDIPAATAGTAIWDAPDTSPQMQGSALFFPDTTYGQLEVWRRGGRTWFFQEANGTFGPRSVDMTGRWLYANDANGIQVYRQHATGGASVYQQAGGLSLAALGSTGAVGTLPWVRDFRVKKGVGAVALARDATTANFTAIVALSRPAALHSTVSIAKQRMMGVLFNGPDLVAFNDDQPSSSEYGIGQYGARSEDQLDQLGWSQNGLINPQLYQYDVLHEPAQLLNRLTGTMGEWGNMYTEKLCSYDVATPSGAVDVIGCSAAVNVTDEARDYDESYPYGVVLRTGAPSLRLSVIDTRNPAANDLLPFGASPSIYNAATCSDSYALAVKAINGNVWAFSHCTGGLVAQNLTPTINLAANAAPVYLATPGYYASDMTIQGNYLYTVSSPNIALGVGGFSVFNIANPAAPTLVSTGMYQWSCPAFGNTSPRALRVSGNYAYIADNGCGALVVLDITDRANPVVVQEIFGSAASRPDVAGPTIVGSSLGGVDLYELQ